ncbi:hypothetical protein D9M70_522730 [compost metagenome]
MRNTRPSAPLRNCVNRTGPRDDSLTAIAIAASSGASPSSAAAAKNRSKISFCASALGDSGDAARLIACMPIRSIMPPSNSATVRRSGTKRILISSSR